MLLGAFAPGDPTVLGWFTFGCYMLAVGLCFRRAQQEGRRFPWAWNAAALLALGLNKQLDLQSLLIRYGRQVARATGWSAYRHAVEAAIFLVLTFIAGFIMWRRSKQLLQFARANPLLFAGDILVAGYAVIRALSIGHVDTTLGFPIHELNALWIVEVLGLLLILAAAAAKPSRF